MPLTDTISFLSGMGEGKVCGSAIRRAAAAWNPRNVRPEKSAPSPPPPQPQPTRDPRGQNQAEDYGIFGIRNFGHCAVQLIGACLHREKL